MINLIWEKATNIGRCEICGKFTSNLRMAREEIIDPSYPYGFQVSAYLCWPKNCGGNAIDIFLKNQLKIIRENRKKE